MPTNENKEYFDKIVSLVNSVCPSCHYRIGFDGVCGFRFWANFLGGFAVLDDFFFGFAVSNTPKCPPRIRVSHHYCPTHHTSTPRKRERDWFKLSFKIVSKGKSR